MFLEHFWPVCRISGAKTHTMPKKKTAGSRDYRPSEQPLKHIFISHTGADSQIAEQLTRDLRDAGHEAKVDTLQLKFGDNAIDFMNSMIAEAHTVIILYSQHSVGAKWQKLEIDAAISNEVNGGGKCIVIRLDDSDVPKLLAAKVYARLTTNTGAEYKQLIEKLCCAVLPPSFSSSIVADAFGRDNANPFRRDRAEYFEGSAELHARTFASPETSKVGTLEEMKPCFLEGARGTGKSMLLLSLRARNYLARLSVPNPPITIFGAYLKLTPGALCTAGMPTSINTDPTFGLSSDDFPIVDISAQEIFISIIESVVSELRFCFDQTVMSREKECEAKISQRLGRCLFPTVKAKFRTLSQIRDELGVAHRQLADFIKKRFIYRESCPVPFTHFDLELLRIVFDILRTEIPSLRSTMFVVLLDEYENLFPFQQRVVNGIVKLGAPQLTVKIARKVGTFDTASTTAGQELQEIHDYNRIPLAYDVENDAELREYQDLLEKIVRNTLSGFTAEPVSLDKLLPKFVPAEVDESEMRAEVAKLCKMTPEKFGSLDRETQDKKVQYYRMAATYRCLYGGKRRRQSKRFAGKEELAILSSGIIRYFQEFVGVAYHLAFPSGPKQHKTLQIGPEFQSRAVHVVSRHNIATLSRNIETYGEILKYLLLDLGDCLRHRLLHHTSEPEAARLTVVDPERLALKSMSDLRRILTVGVREGVFQSKEGLPAFRPKHDSDPIPIEINICRLFAPALEISPRLRWRTSITCDELCGLIAPESRSATLGALKRAWAKATQKPTQKRKKQVQGSLFSGEEGIDEIAT